ncbi:RAD23 family protein [Nakamurella panacisegetis]|uniref:hypothetical protein n=1 Tax=Nakamurella panacisegetis TaxID=1090615 RepID=UPI0012FD1573|nr:hypothetical protein [Nakamurella panacisegetis]
MATRSHRLTIALLAGLVVVLVAGGASAVAVSRHEQRSSADGTIGRTTQSTAGPSATAPRPTSSGRTRHSDSPAPASAAPTVAASAPASSVVASSPQPQSDPSTAPAGPSNNLTVMMSPAVRAHPRSQEVQQLLQSYFDAINQHDYASWTQSVTGALAARQNNQQWLLAYATTVDSSIWMQSMSDDPLEVQMRFTSQQDADLAPSDLQVACIHWSLIYQFSTEDGHLVVGSTIQGSVKYVKCAGQ